MVTETPHKYKNLKEAYDSMKAQYNSNYHYEITIDDDQDVVVKVRDKDDKEIGYLEDI